MLHTSLFDYSQKINMNCEIVALTKKIEKKLPGHLGIRETGLSMM